MNFHDTSIKGLYQVFPRNQTEPRKWNEIGNSCWFGIEAWLIRITATGFQTFSPTLSFTRHSL